MTHVLTIVDSKTTNLHATIELANDGLKTEKLAKCGIRICKMVKLAKTFCKRNFAK